MKLLNIYQFDMLFYFYQKIRSEASRIKAGVFHSWYLVEGELGRIFHAQPQDYPQINLSIILVISWI